MKWLKEFPSTNALCFSGIALAWASFIASLWGWQPPSGWFVFVASLSGAGIAQFSAKRMTWKPTSPQRDGDS